MSDNYKYGTKLLNEWMVDIIGALIPGFLFIITIIISLIIPLLFNGFSKETINIKLTDAFWWFLLIVSLILSYVIGHIFYRSDIKVPDTKCLEKQTKENIVKITIDRLNKGEDIKNLILEELFLLQEYEYYDKVKERVGYSLISIIDNIVFDKTISLTKKNDILNFYRRELNKDLLFSFEDKPSEEKELIIYYCVLKSQTKLGCSSPQYSEFPYECYKKFLKRRHEDDLMTKDIEWNTDGSRTKNKINKIKLDVQLFAPESYPIINKNESQIRMSSSTYHITNPLIFITIISFFIILSVTYTDFKTEQEYCYLMFFRHHLTILCPILMLFLILYIKRCVIKYIHYQRVREIHYLLSIYNQYTDIIEARKKYEINKLKL
ncbi:MAG: hypothetical protein IJ213_03665 [Bacteroidales bacterium]|nr:hypothetical protein [Bacteroidales bacterium]